MARWPSIMCATYLVVAGPLFLWPPVAFFPPLPLAFVTRSSISAASASSGFKSSSLRLLLLVFVPWWLRLNGCWSAFDGESAVVFVGALDCGLGSMGSVAVVGVNKMVVGGCLTWQRKQQCPECAERCGHIEYSFALYIKGPVV
jgi:hypothetical protein